NLTRHRLRRRTTVALATALAVRRPGLSEHSTKLEPRGGSREALSFTRSGQSLGVGISLSTRETAFSSDFCTMTSLDSIPLPIKLTPICGYGSPGPQFVPVPTASVLHTTRPAAREYIHASTAVSCLDWITRFEVRLVPKRMQSTRSVHAPKVAFQTVSGIAASVLESAV